VVDDAGGEFEPVAVIANKPREDHCEPDRVALVPAERPLALVDRRIDLSDERVTLAELPDAEEVVATLSTGVHHQLGVLGWQVFKRKPVRDLNGGVAGGATEPTAEQTSTADVLHPPTMPPSLAEARGCGSLDTPDGLAYDVYLVKRDVSFACADARNVVASGVDVDGWVYFDWTKGGNGPWSDVWQRADTEVLIGAVLTDWPGKTD
jgi:hypothetical protein